MNEILQSVPFAVVLLVIGFVFLVKGADAFVEGCSSVAKRFHVPTLIIGMTIVAMGTSLPETAVSITASISGNNALAVSNAVGSNIFNLMVVVGVCAVLTPLAVQVGILKRDFPLSIACAILLLILGAIDMTPEDDICCRRRADWRDFLVAGPGLSWTLSGYNGIFL